MRKKVLLIAVGVGIAVIFATTGIHAGKEIKDEIKMENPAYKKHKKGVVKFEHKKHWDAYSKEYPEFYKNGTEIATVTTRLEELKEQLQKTYAIWERLEALRS